MSRGRYGSMACGVCLALALSSGMAVASGVGAGASGERVRLETGEYDLSALENVLAVQRPNVRLEAPALIHVTGPMTKEHRAALQAAGVQLGDYLPDNNFIADLSGADLGALAAMDFVTWAGAFRPEWKVAADFGTRVRTSDPVLMEIQNRGELAVNVWLFPQANHGETLAAISAIEGVSVAADMFEGDTRLVQITAPRGVEQALAAIDGVRWIEDAPELTLRNNTSRWVVQSNVNNFYPIYDAGIRGEGQIVGVMDGRMNPNHCSFSDPEGDPFGPNHRKIEAYNTATGNDTHGTHVSGTAVGDAGSFADTRGVAYLAKMVFNSIPSFSDAGVYTRLQTHHNQGARVHTNSWGNDGTTSYDGLARGIDRFSYDNDESLVCLAVTNTSTLKNPENAKNLLAVAASQDTPGQENFCSGGAGPTNDGRRKPEIMAPGCSIRSSFGSACSVTGLTGTSMACPHIAGAGALVRQYFEDGFYPSGAANAADSFLPSGPLVKAMLLNSGQDMTGLGGYPGTREGWGRVKLDESMVLVGGDESIIVRQAFNNAGDALNTGDVVTVQFEVDQIATPLVVTLVWHDAPASVGANPAAVNNLDLEVVTPDFSFIGNNFSGGFSTPGGVPDDDNNVEVVRTTTTSTGTYTAVITASGVNVGAQGYALVIRGAVSENTGPQPCNEADFAEPFGTLDFSDVVAFLSAFGAMDPAADLASPFGSWDFSDVVAFLSAFGAGCP